MLKGILAIVIGFLLVKAFCDTVLDIFFGKKVKHVWCVQ